MPSSPEVEGAEKNSFNPLKYAFGKYGGIRFAQSSSKNGKQRGMDATFGSFSGRAFASKIDTDKEAPASSGSYGVSFGRKDDLITATAKNSLSQIKEKWVEENRSQITTAIQASVKFPNDGPLGLINAELCKSLSETVEKGLSHIFDAEVGTCVKKLQETVDTEYAPDMRVKAAVRIQDEVWVAKNADRLQKEHTDKNAKLWRRAYEDQERDNVIRELKASQHLRVIALLEEGNEVPELALLKHQYVDAFLHDAVTDEDYVEIQKKGDDMSAVNRMLYSTSPFIHGYCSHALSRLSDEQPSFDHRPRSPVDNDYSDNVDQHVEAPNRAERAARASPRSSRAGLISRTLIDEGAKATNEITNEDEDGRAEAPVVSRREDNDDDVATSSAANVPALGDEVISLPDYESLADTYISSVHGLQEAVPAGESVATETHPVTTAEEITVVSEPSGGKRKRADQHENVVKKAKKRSGPNKATQTAQDEASSRRLRSLRPRKDKARNAKSG